VNADTSPRLLSIEFHTRFFPALLRDRLRHKHQTGSRFSPPFERYLALLVCIILVAAGAPAALSRGSIAGWITGVIGAAGILAMLVKSIASRRGAPASWSDFLVGFFFFFLSAGFTTGIFIGTLEHYPIFHGLLTCAAGLIAGYVLGILAGFMMQYLGWLPDVTRYS
jgi:hypothetical protein